MTSSCHPSAGGHAFICADDVIVREGRTCHTQHPEFQIYTSTTRQEWFVLPSIRYKHCLAYVSSPRRSLLSLSNGPRPRAFSRDTGVSCVRDYRLPCPTIKNCGPCSSNEGRRSVASRPRSSSRTLERCFCSASAQDEALCVASTLRFTRTPCYVNAAYVSKASPPVAMGACPAIHSFPGGYDPFRVVSFTVLSTKRHT